MNNTSFSRADLTPSSAEATTKYARSPIYQGGFMFPRSEVRDRACLDQAFAQHGYVITDVQYEGFGMWVWVLTDDGQLWLNDFSHGGGGQFVPQRPATGKTH